MANNYWNNSQANNDGNDPLNWSLGNVPAGTDVAVFDNTSDTNCTFSGNISTLGLNANAVYDGNIDFGDSLSHAWGASGMVFDHAGNFDLGTGTTHTITGGPCDLVDCSGTRDYATSTLVFDGSCSLVLGVDDDPYNITNNNGATLAISGAVGGYDLVQNAVVNNGAMTCIFPGFGIGTNATFANDGSGLDLQFGENPGGLFRHGAFLMYYKGAITSNTGGIRGASANNVVLSEPINGTATFAPGAYPVLKIANRGTARFDAGAFTLDALELESGHTTVDLTLDLTTNDPTITITGDLTIDIDSTRSVILAASSNALILQGDLVDEITGAGTFTVDSQDLILDGTNDQGIDGCGGTWGVWIILKTAAGNKVTLTGGFSCGEVSFARGTLDLNGQTLDVSGDMTIAAGKGNSLADLAGSTINCDNLVANGASGADLVGSATWYLNCTTSGTLHYLTITNCDASGGVEVDATNNCVDGGGNTNVKFVGATLPLINGGLINAGLIGGGLIR